MSSPASPRVAKAGREVLAGAHDQPRLGELLPQVDDARADTTTLNLNAAHLVDGRARVIRELRVKLSRDDSVPAIQRLLRVASIPGSDGLTPYAHVAAAYLAKKLRARSR